MKNLVFVLGMLVFNFQAKAQFFDKLADKAVNAATNSIEKKVEEKSTEYTEKAADAVFEPIDKKTEKKERKGKKDKKERDSQNTYSNSDENSTSVSLDQNFFTITQNLFDKNSSELKTEKIPELDKIGNYLKENPEARISIKANLESDENAAELSDYRAMAIKTVLVRNDDVIEDFISIEISQPGKPNNRYVEIRIQ